MRERALLIRLGAIGDTIHASGAAGLLKKQSPDMEIDFLVSAGLEPIFSMIPHVERAFGLRFRKIPYGIHPGWIRLCKRLNEQPYRLAFLMETDPRFASLLDRIHAERKIAMGDEMKEIRDNFIVPNAVRYQRALWTLGLAPEEIVHPRLFTGEDHKEQAGALLTELGLDPGEPVVGIHPGNSFRKRKKMRRWVHRTDLRAWPEDRWCSLICGMFRINNRVQILLFGSKHDRSTNERIRRRVVLCEPEIRLADAAGKTDLPLAAAVLERFCLFISTDTGPIHMAAALGVPLLGLYGPTRYDETLPFSAEQEAVVLRSSLDCQPCYGTSRQKRCRDNLCMQAIRVDDVLKNAIETRKDIFYG